MLWYHELGCPYVSHIHCCLSYSGALRTMAKRELFCKEEEDVEHSNPAGKRSCSQ